MKRGLLIAALFITTLTGIADAAIVKPGDAYRQPPEWWTGEEARVVVDRILSYQLESGGWPKNYRLDQDRTRDTKLEWDGMATIDNGATYVEMRLLALSFNATQREDAKEAFLRGVEFLVATQYANGGWPQRFPPPQDSYGRAITFNDNAMTGVMRILQDIADNAKGYEFVNEERREKAKAAFDHGLAAVLKMQVRDAAGNSTGWAAQYDADTLQPTGARTFEPAALSGGEGAGIVLMLMMVPQPSEDVKQAVEGAVKWFDAVTITGKRVEDFTDEKGEPHKRLVDDPAAPPIWPRFAEIGTNRPLFTGRDGVVKYDISQIDSERTMHYRWFGNWGGRVAEEYAKWKARVGG